MASCHNSLGGYGILPYPLRPLNILKGGSGLRCTNRGSIAIFPQVSWEFGCVSPPTEFTDLHRGLVASVLPRISQKFGCVSPPTDFTEFTEVRLRKSFHRFHGIHRSLGVLLAAWVWQDAIPSYICVNPCYLLETLLCKKLLCFPWVLWEYSLPRISQINTDGWLR